MSNPLAIAAISAVLRARLKQAVGGPWTPELPRTRVVTLPPDHVAVTDETGPILNVFLWEVRVLPADRAKAPAGRVPAPGDRRPIPIVVSYLVSAYGVLTLDADILLGQVITNVVEQPVIAPDAVRAVLDPDSEDESGVVPRIFRREAVLLADTIAHLSLTIRPVTFGDWTEVWQAARAPVRPSLMIDVSGAAL